MSGWIPERGEDRRGTLLDWPAAVIVLGLLVVITAESGQRTMLAGLPPILGWAAIVVGVASLAIRRGAFSPRD